MKLKPLSKCRNKLVAQHLDFAHSVAGKVHVGLPPFIPLDDLKQEAAKGLVKAARKYNFESSVPFRAYAYRQIHGQVIESIRRKNFRHTSTLQLTEFPDVVESLQHEDTTEADIDRATVRRELGRAIAMLPAAQRQLLKLRYEHGLNGREAGEAMGVGACVSSLQHKEAIQTLRRRLEQSPHFAELKKAA